MLLFAVVSSLLQLSVIHGAKENIITRGRLRCFTYCSLTQWCEQVTRIYNPPGKWFCDFKNGKKFRTPRKNVFGETYVQISTDVYHRGGLLKGMDSDSTLETEDGSGRLFEESEDNTAKKDSKLGISADTVRTTPNPFLDSNPSAKDGILRDCSILKKQQPHARSGVYTINPGRGTPFRVYCDLTTESHAWTVIQRRRGGPVRFNRTSAEYNDGFGDLKKTFWLGNDKIRRLTEGTVSQLRFDFEDFNGIRIHAVYTPFSIAGRTDEFRLQIGTYFGNAGDSFREADGQSFSTEDNDKDGKYFESCAETCSGGWWYKACGRSCLNGLYQGGAIVWKDWNGASIKYTQMKIRSLEQVKDCTGLPKHKNGSYIVNPDGKRSFPAYCDTATEDGNWMVIQRRISGSEDFFRKFSEYARGFGDTDGEFWIGNDVLNRLTKSGYTMLRIDFENLSGQKRYAIYQDFKVASKADYYRLSIGNYSGNAGDSLRISAGQQFSTKDMDRDYHLIINCARNHKGAWWYNNRHTSNLNGHYNNSRHTLGIVWRGLKYPITFTEMKVKQ